MKKKICVLGMGYIGLPTSAMFANHGHEVIGVDVNENVVGALNHGEITIEEPGLQGFVRSAVEKGNLRAQSQPEKADVYIIAVPTPISQEQKADLSYVEAATNAIVPFVCSGNIVIVESTIPPRTITDVVNPILKQTGLELGTELYVAHCPERVLPGQILIELVHNNRIVGGINDISAHKAAEVYQSFVKGEIYKTDATSAEMAKLMENTFRDVNIALANELTMISERLGVNALEVIKMANKHPRVNIHQPGPGVGGHCIAVDPYFIIEKAPEEAKMIMLAREINNSMPIFVVDQMHKICHVNPRKVAVLGITYKGNIDDVRESPALEILEILQNEGILFSIYDPHVKHFHERLAQSLEEALTGADCAVILADHNEFKQVNYDDLARLMSTPIILDTKNCISSPCIKMQVHRLGNYDNRLMEGEVVEKVY
ncbi:nucleotide sugar dehydrogenase [Paenibacillus radicis (ex Xue et al. 2023)]|uniref:Nucleotide sugar dehydrogenase n=1 Tax=Paenibacillus radicis (ex Xue et al. 2023) TaxID=2972489 RepID=A0ABT1YJG8_9BACL|nr:nucleotide sugar dehydrogenase [Paenibacillus radicis (ex Xue et al. 2023)]MCR8632413.1 nucleotide sugar dehydrogenase [Paenibacillus radicis (ex Xue et al. 2023)]